MIEKSAPASRPIFGSPKLRIWCPGGLRDRHFTRFGVSALSVTVTAHDWERQPAPQPSRRLFWPASVLHDRHCPQFGAPAHTVTVTARDWEHQPSPRPSRRTIWRASLSFNRFLGQKITPNRFYISQLRGFNQISLISSAAEAVRGISTKKTKEKAR